MPFLIFKLTLFSNPIFTYSKKGCIFVVSNRLLYFALVRYKLFVPYLYRNIYNKLIYRHLHFLYRKIICSPTCFSLLCLTVSFQVEIVFCFLTFFDR